MASPQCEDGFTKIANELLDALIRTNFSGYQRRVLDAIIRKTYGFNKKQDHIAYSQIIEMTEIKMPHVSRALKELRQRQIVTKGGNKIGINKDYSQWQKLPRGVSSHHELPKGVTRVTKGGSKVTNRGKKKLPKGGDTKDTLKDNIQKKLLKDMYCRVINYLNEKTGKKFSAKSKSTQLHIKARITDGYTEDDFMTVIDNKTAKWLTDPNMSDFLRPSTLFGPKFEAYLNDIPHPLEGKISAKGIKNVESFKKWSPPDEE